MNKAVDEIINRQELLWPIQYYESKASQARCFHSIIGDKIIEMLKDPLTTETDWRELLAVCRYADEWFAATHPTIKDFSRKENWVRKILA